MPDQKLHIAKIVNPDFSKLDSTQQDEILANIEAFSQIPKIFEIRFRSIYMSIQALLEAEPIITAVALDDTHPSHELVKNNNIDWDLVSALHSVLRPVIRQIDLFESSERQMGSYISMYEKIIEQTLPSATPVTSSRYR